MSEKIRLTDLFNANKQELCDSLKDVNVMKDPEKAQIITNEFLERLFDEKGDYRMDLTTYEDYILQAALSIVPFRQPENSLDRKADEKSSGESKTYEDYLPLGGTIIGSTIGAFVSGSRLSSMLNPIIFTFIAIYFLSARKKKRNFLERKDDDLSLEHYVDLIENICIRVDDFMDVVRAQFEKMENSYKSAGEQSLYSYPFLLESLKDLATVAQNENSSKEAVLSQIKIVLDSLENYGVKL